jgi:glycerate kinase
MRRRLLAAPDKFKGSLTASEVAAAIAAGGSTAGWAVTPRAMSDGGEGLIEIAGGPNRSTLVTGPLGGKVAARWRFDPPRAVIEMAEAAGLVLAGGAAGNDPLAATTRGVGELIEAAIAEGATHIVVGCGGSATTDGGEGAYRVLDDRACLAGVRLIVACDVRVGFLEAARVFGPQKGAEPADIAELEKRLSDLARRYEESSGLNVTTLPGSGAAGGLAGGLAALGGELVEGFALVAEMTGFDALVGEADAIVTGEGCLDAESFSGKVAGSVAARARGRATACVCGRSTPAGRRLATEVGLGVLDLSAAFGEVGATSHPVEGISALVAGWLAAI